MVVEKINPGETEGVCTLKRRLGAFDTEQSRRKGLAFQLQPDDVLIATYSKCGTTFVQQIVHQLRTGGSTDYGEISEVVPWLEMADACGVDLSAPQPGAPPRVYKTHFWYPACPKGSKVIYVSRDPVNALSSMYHFFNGWLFDADTVSLEEFADNFWLKRGMPASELSNAGYWENVTSWWAHRNDPNVLWLHYEELTREHPRCVRRVAAFLGFDADDDDEQRRAEARRRIDEAVKRSTREYMLQHQHHFDESLTRRTRNPAMGIPVEAGTHSARKVKPDTASSAASVPEDIKQRLQQRWRAVVTPATSFQSYDDLLEHVIHCRAQGLPL